MKNTLFSIDLDLPREIKQARSRLWPKYKQYKRDNPRVRVSNVYPAKLIMDNRLICDEMPKWRYIGADRLAIIEPVKNGNQYGTHWLRTNTPNQTHINDTNYVPHPSHYTPDQLKVVSSNTNDLPCTPNGTYPDIQLQSPTQVDSSHVNMCPYLTNCPLLPKFGINQIQKSSPSKIYDEDNRQS